MKLIKSFVLLVSIFSLFFIAACDSNNPIENEQIIIDPDPNIDPPSADINEIIKLLKASRDGERPDGSSDEFDGQFFAGIWSGFSVSSRFQALVTQPMVFARIVNADHPFGIDMGVVAVNDSSIRKQVATWRKPNDNLGTGVDYIEFPRDPFAPHRLDAAVTTNGSPHSWSIEGTDSFSPLDVSLLSPDDISITAPVNNSLVSSGNDITVNWAANGAGQNSIVLADLTHWELTEISGGHRVTGVGLFETVITEGESFTIPAAVLNDFVGKALHLALYRVEYKVVEHDGLKLLFTAQTSDFVGIQVN